MAVKEALKSMPGEAQLWPLSIQAYRTLGELGLVPKSTELLYGQVFQKMSKSPFHSALVRRLLRLLQKAGTPGCFLSSEQPITCGDSEPEPDVAVIRGSEEEFWKEHPKSAELVIEVCVTSHDYERSKLQAYAHAGVKEVWFVLGPEKQIEVHRQPVGDRFLETLTQGPGGELASAAVPVFKVQLEPLFKT
jgi:Uma2 family endonuclease